MRRTGAIVAATVVLLTSRPAAAEAPLTDAAGIGGEQPGVMVGSTGSGDGGGSSGPSPYSSCTTTDVSSWITSAVIGSLDALGGRPSVSGYSGGLGMATCELLAGGVDEFMVGFPTAPDALTLATAAAADIELALPTVLTSPPRGGVQLVGVPVWFWIEAVGAVSASASIPGLTATVTATPAGTRYAFSDGTSLECAGLGTPYDPGVGHRAQHSDCTHVFDDFGPMVVEASQTWTITWTATNGQGGVLPAVVRTSTFTLPLQEGQAVTD